MTPYAAGTTVPVEKSKAELDALLGKHGATSRGVMSDDAAGIAYIFFALKGDRYQLSLPLPRLESFPNPGSIPKGWGFWDQGRRDQWRSRAYEQACRERWRALLLMVKSKLEIVRLGMSDARHEFMADLVLANGKTIAEMVAADPSRLLPAAGETGGV
jgi:hypothetical protein